jgi:hypothetical protein
MRAATNHSWHLTAGFVNATVGFGLVLIFAGTIASVLRTSHPMAGNDQVGLRRAEAWGTNGVIAAFTLVLLFVLPR